MNTNFAIRAIFAIAVLGAMAAFAPTAEAGLTLYASDAGRQQLFTLNPANASASLVGSFGTTGINGLAYDSTDNILFGSDGFSNGLYRVDPATGAATLVGPLGIGQVQALAFDSSTGKLYGAYGDGSTPSLYQIDPTTGAATLVGAIGHAISGLSFDPMSHVLFGSGAFNLGLFTIDPATGQTVSTISSTVGFNGISFEPTTDQLYGVTNGAGSLAEGLYTISTTTGSANLVGSLSLDNPLDIQFVFTPSSVPEPSSLVMCGIAGAVGLVVTGIRRERTTRLCRGSIPSEPRRPGYIPGPFSFVRRRPIMPLCSTGSTGSTKVVEEAETGRFGSIPYSSPSWPTLVHPGRSCRAWLNEAGQFDRPEGFNVGRGSAWDEGASLSKRATSLVEPPNQPRAIPPSGTD